MGLQKKGELADELAAARTAALGWEVLARMYELKLCGLWDEFVEANRPLLDQLRQKLDSL